MSIKFEKNQLSNFDATMSLEWLSANGLGGYASGTVAGANSRKYHGYLVAAAHPPVGRYVLLSRVEDTVQIGDRKYPISTNEFPDCIDPKGCENIVSFNVGAGPTWTFQCGDAIVEKSITLVHGQDAVIIRYRLVKAPPRAQSVQLKVRPLLAGRDFHATITAANRPGWWLDETGGHRDMMLLKCHECPLPVFISHNADRFNAGPCWWYNFVFRQERARGYPDRDDLWTPGQIEFTLSGEKSATIIAATRPTPVTLADELLARQTARHQRLVTQFSVAAPDDDFIAQLSAAADQFLVRRGTSAHGVEKMSVIAGYPWFEDWGRDTFISLPGLTLVRGDAEAARGILVAFADHIADGLTPNRFPDKGSEPDYNTVDASLWFIQAAYQYWRYTGDDKLLRSYLYAPLCQIIEKYRDGTRFGIRMDTDGLIRAGVPGIQLTWMDAKVGTDVITPRYGKPVEINALWFNALNIMALVAGSAGDAVRAESFSQLAQKTGQAFAQKFWNQAAGCLYDVLGDDGKPDAAVRPNQIMAVSLPFSPLAAGQAKEVVAVAERLLLTPLGMRTLAPGSMGYCGRYEGDQNARDHAYHMGTAWPWLTGQFITALVRSRGGSAESRQRAREILSPFESHLRQAGLGSISEIADGDAPWLPRGCIAQAWSVGEVLRAYWEDVLGKAPAWPHEAAASKIAAKTGAKQPTSAVVG